MDGDILESFGYDPLLPSAEQLLYLYEMCILILPVAVDFLVFHVLDRRNLPSFTVFLCGRASDFLLCVCEGGGVIKNENILFFF